MQKQREAAAASDVWRQEHVQQTGGSCMRSQQLAVARAKKEQARGEEDETETAVVPVNCLPVTSGSCCP